MAFTSSSGFSLGEDVLAKLRRSSFGGRSVGPEAKRAAIEAGLNVDARRESDQANRVAALNEAALNREQQESQFERSQAFSRRESDKQRSADFKGGIASAATSAISTVVGFKLLKHFKII